MAELISADSAAVSGRTALLPRRITAAIAELPVGTLLTLELRRRWWDRRPRRLALAGLQRLLSQIQDRTERLVIVAAALIGEGAVLVAQRNHPPELAGQWEFPGGKVERGETARTALIRECAEELGCQIQVGVELARQRLSDGAELVLLQAALAPDSPPPTALEHRELRWARPAELAVLDLVATNRRFVTDVTGRL
ncbi:MAG: (deoxy)nucleoside triphosphate pyrophosphohydrolase [Jatrophihabitans sp.]